MSLLDHLPHRIGGDTWSRRASRSSTIPSVWSSSASVKTIPSTGTCRVRAGGAIVGRRPAGAWTSGDALSRNQRAPSALTAAEDWLRGTARRGSERATRHEGHQQFHCGKPPPAAVPRRTTCTGKRRVVGKTEGPAFASPSGQSLALQGRDVRGDFHRDGNDLGLGLGPLHVLVLPGL